MGGNHAAKVGVWGICLGSFCTGETLMKCVFALKRAGVLS